MISQGEEIAIQVRCVNCRKEHHMQDAIAVSKGERPCRNCGHESRRMTESEYKLIFPIHITTVGFTS